ncbi:unnamed protein product [Bursaphelenchus okinawaensis]|uniref:WD_REPEATS_REGION domain-containing protein n=1 Tax=Bursaphelenchus okinawaensis TaxID=465554 RepID=A0A811L114_9BILA|nr:unnamed protein product [Bursaphelenchus okinawaensis]CAG9115749.1 unnamed protein product [Bursaphelenchus okinawaensis]
MSVDDVEMLEDEQIEEEAIPENMEEVPDESLVALKVHDKDIFTISLSQDGKRLLTGGEDDKAVFWNLENVNQGMTLNRLLEGHTDSVVSVAFNGTNTLFCTADMAGKIQIFDSKTGEKLYDVDYCDDLEWTIWHSQADILLAGTSSGQIYMFLLSRKQIEKVKTYTSETNAPCVDGRLLPGSQNLLAVYGDGRVISWTLKDSSYMTLKLHTAATALDAHFEHPLVAVGTGNGVTHIVNTTNMKSVLKLGVVDKTESEEQVEDSVETVKFAQGYPWIAVGSSNGMLVVYDYETGQARHECAHDTMAVVKCMWWKPDANSIRILSACIDGAVRCWDAKSGDPLLFKCGAGQEIFDFTMGLVNNEPLVFCACAGGYVRVYRYEEKQLELENDVLQEGDVEKVEE